MNSSLTGSRAEKCESSSDLEWVDEIPECPVYHPSTDEFQDPLAYIQTIAQEASTYGICKIVPKLKASVPAFNVLTKEQTGFKAYVQPLRLQQWNEKDPGTFLIGGSKQTYKSFEKKASKEFAKRLSSSLPFSIL